MKMIEGLEIQAGFVGPVLKLKLIGNADPRDGTTLAAEYLQWHHQMVKTKAVEARIDVRDVEFMNSTALGAFVSWVAELQTIPLASRYKITFEGNPAKRWQRASLHALASFAPELISVSFPERAS